MVLINACINSFLFFERSKEHHDRDKEKRFMLGSKEIQLNAPAWVGCNHYALKLKKQGRIHFYYTEDEQEQMYLRDKAQKVNNEKSYIDTLKQIALDRKIIIGEHLQKKEIQEIICSELDITIEQLKGLINENRN